MPTDDDPVMQKIRTTFEKSRMTMHSLGLAMGYPADSARKSVSQFLKGGDPRISTLRRFAKATKLDIGRLLK